MTDDEFDRLLRKALMEAVMEDLGPVWRGEQPPQGDDQALMDAAPVEFERIWKLVLQRQEEEKNGPPEDL